MTARRQRPVDTAQRCFYADDPVLRPRCTLTATVRLGSVALCPSCHTDRSSVGKGQPTLALPPGHAVDVLDRITTAHEQAKLADQTLTAPVTRARQTGASWTQIGTQLGVTRQAAQQRFTRASTHESTTTATRAS